MAYDAYFRVNRLVIFLKPYHVLDLIIFMNAVKRLKTYYQYLFIHEYNLSVIVLIQLLTLLSMVAKQNVVTLKYLLTVLHTTSRLF